MFLHRVEYRTVEGEVISRLVNLDYGVTVEDINDLACQYLEKTHRSPDIVFLRVDVYKQLISAVARQYVNHTVGANMTSLWLSTGNGKVPVVAVPHSYTPVFVGSREEFRDNDINAIFEETVLKDCEQI